MEKQQQHLIKFFTSLGYANDVATTKATSFFASENPEMFGIDEVLTQAQAYALPHVKTAAQKEFNVAAKRQYMGEALGKLVSASKGKIQRAKYEDDADLTGAIADFVSIVEQGSTSTDAEKDQTINQLREQLASAALEKETAITQLRGEFSEKENGRMVYDGLASVLASIQKPADGKVGKKLSVDNVHALKSVLRELNDDYILRWEEDGKTVGVYDKKNPEQKAYNSDRTRFVNVQELVEQSLQRNNWIAESNGSLPVSNLSNTIINGQRQETKKVDYVDSNTATLAANLAKHIPQ